MNSQVIHSAIREILVQFLTEGLIISTGTLFFAESTYGITETELEATLKDRDFEEQDILLNLLFFPTSKMRVELEPLLVDFPLTADNIGGMVAAISAQVHEVRFRTENGIRFSYPLNGSVLTHFVDKFYMRRKLDPIITNALAAHYPEHVGTRVKVNMRCRDFSFSKGGSDFLAAFIARSADRTGDVEGLVALLMILISQKPAQKPIVEHLFDQREYQKKLLHDIKEFEAKSSQYGMEYLMMQNYQVPHESEENAVALLNKFNSIIDDILMLPPPPITT